MKLGHCDTQERVLIVAEIGNNHEGNPAVARKLIDRAADCGVDAVKFQTYKTERFVRPTDPDRFARLKSFELTVNQWDLFSKQVRAAGLLFLSTPLDLESVGILRDLVDGFKIASGDLTFYPLLEQVATTAKPVILSSGLGNLTLIQTALTKIQEVWNKHKQDCEIAVLHCVSAYPPPLEEANLLSIPYLANHLPCPVGYSDHIPGIEAAVAAVAIGARIIEKHFTLDKNYSAFRDHSLSADPSDMKELVRRVRDVERMRGFPTKHTQPSEVGSVLAFRRSIAASRDLQKGHPLAWGDLTWLRPGGGLEPGQEPRLLGRRLLREVKGGEWLSLADVDTIEEKRGGF